MDHESNTLEVIRKEGHGSLTSYVIGFILSITLTFAAYYLVVEKTLPVWPLILTISALAVGQVLVQLFFFLHLGNEPSPPWNLVVFLFMLQILLILVGGTLWIMYSLDYLMMGPMAGAATTPSY